MPHSLKQRANRLLTTSALAVTLLSIANGTAAATTHAPGTPRKPSLPAAVHAGSAVNNRLTASQALQLAQATSKTVVVGSLTTASSLTRVDPAGRYILTESLAPVRAWRAGRWLTLNPELRRGPRGRLVPAVTASGVSLSAGGSGSLAALSNAGWAMNVNWLGPLPAPTVSGSTATYQNVPVQGADVVVTVSSLGSVAIVAEATNKAAAQTLASIKLMTSSPGLSLTSDNAGNLAFSETPGVEPVFTAQAPQTWDSAPLPSGTPVTTDPVSGEQLAVPSGLPAQSSTSGPGGMASPVAAPVAVSGGTITVSPSAAVWTGHATAYPVYTALVFAPDFTKDASAWAEISSNAATSWMPTGCLDGRSGQCLQVGFCDKRVMVNCGDIVVSRTLLRFPIPALPAGTKVANADVYLENVWTAACQAEPLDLWAIPPFSRSTGWASRRSWNKRLEQETFHGYGATKSSTGGKCGPGYRPRDVIFGTGSGTKKGVRIIGGSAGSLGRAIGTELAAGARSISLGLRAPDESTTSTTSYLQWRQFMDKHSAIILKASYFHLPSVPSQLSSNPGGPCQTSRTSPAQVGADGLTLYARASDPDRDKDLKTTFAVYTAASGHSRAHLKYHKARPGAGLVQTPYLPNGLITSWQPHGSTRAYLYYYTARTADAVGSGLTSTKCYILYNPRSPAAPIITGYLAHVHLGQVLHGVRFAPAGGCPMAANCPASYTYQIGDGPSVTVAPGSPGTGTFNKAKGTWTGTLVVPELGPLPLTVTAANAAGNSGPASTPIADSVPPAPLADGYFSGGPQPDLLFTGSGRQPSLWVAPGTGRRTVGAPVDIGSVGDRPQGSAADWAGALILHGDFTGDHVQDVMAYRPPGSGGIRAGTGFIVGGTGDAITLDPVPGDNSLLVLPEDLCDPHFDNCVSTPSDLVAAGDASQQHTGLADLIGYICSGRRCELNLYTATTPASYSLARTLSAWFKPAPDGTRDWASYTLATAQLPDAAHPHGDPADTVLFALNRMTGHLYESADRGCPSDCGKGPFIGSPGKWRPVRGVPWGSSPPQLLSADTTNQRGPGTGGPEIWTRRSGTASATAYGLTGSGSRLTLSAGHASSITTPADEWPLTGRTTDIITGKAGRLHGTHRWENDPVFTTVLSTHDGYLTPPPTAIPGRRPAHIAISAWFKTTNHGGVLASLQNRPLTPGSARSTGYAPLLYIGLDGHLHGLWPEGAAPSPLRSPGSVATGTWQHAMLTASTSGSRTTQRLYLNGRLVAARSTSAVNLLPLGPATNLTIAAGYLGGAWPSQPHHGKAHPDYFTGQLADITIIR